MNHKAGGIKLLFVSTALIFVLVVCSRGQAPKQNSNRDTLRSLNESLEQVATTVFPAIVHIEVVSYEPSSDRDDDAKVQTVSKQRGSGSGMIVDSGGYVVTAFHVIDKARRIRVELDSHVHPPGEGNNKHRLSFEPKIVGIFKEADIAVLKIDAKDLPTVSFSSSNSLKQGELVAALGGAEGFRNSLSLGVVSAVERQIEPDDSLVYVQTDAALAAGCSGGPLVNIQGEMVGMDVFSITERGRIERLGFAVPSDVVRYVYQQIRQYGYVPRPYLGIDVQGITPPLASALQLSTDAGIIVSGVAAGSPAEKAALQAGDVIVSIDGASTRSVPQLMWALLHKRQGEHVRLEVVRKSDTVTLNLLLAALPRDAEDSRPPDDVEETAVPRLGIMVSGRKPELTEEKSKHLNGGVMVIAQLRGIDPEPQLNAGDVIRSINAISITSATQLRAVLDSFHSGDAIALHVERKGRLMYIAFELD
jgi:serine protease Do